MTLRITASLVALVAALAAPQKALADPVRGVDESRLAQSAYSGGVTIELSALGELVGFGESPSAAFQDEQQDYWDEDSQIDRLAEAVDDLLPEWVESTLSNSAGLMFSRERGDRFKRSARYTSAPEFLGDAFGQARYRLNFRDDTSTLMVGWTF